MICLNFRPKNISETKFWPKIRIILKIFDIWHCMSLILDQNFWYLVTSDLLVKIGIIKDKTIVSSLIDPKKVIFEVIVRNFTDFEFLTLCDLERPRNWHIWKANKVSFENKKNWAIFFCGRDDHSNSQYLSKLSYLVKKNVVRFFDRSAKIAQHDVIEIMILK